MYTIFAHDHILPLKPFPSVLPLHVHSQLWGKLKTPGYIKKGDISFQILIFTNIYNISCSSFSILLRFSNFSIHCYQGNSSLEEELLWWNVEMWCEVPIVQETFICSCIWSLTLLNYQSKFDRTLYLESTGKILSVSNSLNFASSIWWVVIYGKSVIFQSSREASASSPEKHTGWTTHLSVGILVRLSALILSIWPFYILCNLLYLFKHSV